MRSDAGENSAAASAIPRVAEEIHRDTFATVWISSVIAAVSVVPFFSSIGFEFVQWDDPIQVIDNPYIRHLTLQNLIWMFTDSSYALRYTPLSWVNWSLLYRYWGLDPAAYHAESVLFHAVNAVLVFILLKTLMRRAASKTSSRYSDASAALMTVIWSVHPLRSETVAWVTQARFSQCLFFFLVCILIYIHLHVTSPASRLRKTFSGLCFLAAAASVLTYPATVGIVVILIALDIYPLRRLPADYRCWASKDARVVWKEKIPYAVLACAVTVTSIVGRIQGGPIWSGPIPLSEYDLTHRAMQAFYIVTYYLWKPLVPFHLSPTYSTLFSFRPWDADFVLSAVLVCLASGAAFLNLRRFPAAFATWLSYLVLIVPVSGFMEYLHSSSDRYAHIAMISLLPPGAYGILRLLQIGSRRTAAAMIGVCCVIVIGLGTMARRQTEIWRNDLTLFPYMISELDGEIYRADIYWRLGRSLMMRGRYREAIPFFDRTLAMYDEDGSSQREMRILLFKARSQFQIGDDSGAIQTSQKAIGKRNDPDFHEILVRALARQGRPPEVEKESRILERSSR